MVELAVNCYNKIEYSGKVFQKVIKFFSTNIDFHTILSVNVSLNHSLKNISAIIASFIVYFSPGFSICIEWQYSVFVLVFDTFYRSKILKFSSIFFKEEGS